VTDLEAHARTALEQVCARGDLEQARQLYARDLIHHVDALDFHGQDGIAESVALYRAVLPTSRSAFSLSTPRATTSPLAGACSARIEVGA
jgi:hypothetical protein